LGVNATLIGQTITFVFFIWFTMKFIWPPVIKALDDRQGKIADGLAAAERGHRELELSQHKAAEQLRDAKIKAGEIIERGNIRANQIIEEAKAKARQEGQRLIDLAKAEIEKESQQARQHLRQQVAAVAIAGAEKILQRDVDAAANSEMLNALIKDL